MGRAGLLYVGDCKMAALGTRAGLAAADDYYLCPLPATSLGELGADPRAPAPTCLEA